jgi:hypothetical protein
LGAPIGKTKLDSVTKEVMQSAQPQTIHLPGYIICPSTATAYLPHTAEELLLAETITFASQLQAHLQLAPAEEFPEITMLKYPSITLLA